MRAATTDSAWVSPSADAALRLSERAAAGWTIVFVRMRTVIPAGQRVSSTRLHRARDMSIWLGAGGPGGPHPTRHPRTYIAVFRRKTALRGKEATMRGKEWT